MERNIKGKINPMLVHGRIVTNYSVADLILQDTYGYIPANDPTHAHGVGAQNDSYNDPP